MTVEVLAREDRATGHLSQASTKKKKIVYWAAT